MKKEQEIYAYKLVSKGHYSLLKDCMPKKYVKRYLKGKTTKALKGTMGIFCYNDPFTTTGIAKRYAKRHNSPVKILLVKLKGKIIRPLAIGNPALLDDFYNNYSVFYERSKATISMGECISTVCAEEVEVITEVVICYPNGKVKQLNKKDMPIYLRI